MCARGRKVAKVGAVTRRAGVGPQDAVQHAGTEPSVWTAPSSAHRRGQLFLEHAEGSVPQHGKFNRTQYA